MAGVLGCALGCSDGGKDGAPGGDGDDENGGEGNATSGGTSGAPMGGTSGASRGGASGSSGSSGEGGEGGDAGAAGSGGTTPDLVPLPPGSRELDGIVNLVDAAAAAELDAYLTASGTRPYWEGGLTVSLNLFLEHYVEQYDFVYVITDHPVATGAIGRFENVTQPASPGIGKDFDWEREGYKTNGTVRGVIGVQYRPQQYGPFGHEMVHYWANFLHPSFGFGIGLNENAGPHWGYAGMRGVLGGFEASTLRCETPTGAMPPGCTATGSGRTRYVVELFFSNDNGVATPCSPLELYLMGLLPLSEVPPSIPVLTEAEALYDTYDETTGTFIVEASGLDTVAVSDIAAQHGMVRELPEAERAFRAAFVVISAEPASDAVLAEVADWAKIHGNRLEDADILSFEALTGGRATLDTELGARRSVEDPAPEVRVPFGCDVYEQDCDDDKACFFAPHQGGICGLSRGALRDAACDESYDCAPGLDCVANQAGTAGACEPYCSPDDTAPDACSSQCPWYELVDENDVVVAGICQGP